jgi:flotillin
MENQFQSSITEKPGFLENYLASGSPARNPVSVEIAQMPTNRSLGNTQTQNLSVLGLSLPLIVSGVVGLSLLIWFITSFMCICNPNEVLVLSGRKHKTKEGKEVGYRVIFGGRTIRIPILETVKRMDLRTMAVPIEIHNAYSKGGTPLQIHAIANVKISSDASIAGNAIERFLDHHRGEISRVARETLEGNLRGVVATLTPEQLNEDRLRFAERIAQDVEDDLVRLGLHLDTLKIQSVSDDLDYLNSIGRKQIAQIVRDAEIAESNSKGEADRVEAQCEQEAEVAKTQARTIIQEKENELRRIKAELEQQARSEEERTKAAAKEARARAEQQLQTIRAQLERLRLEADEVLPAEADKQAQELHARGEAAVLSENASAAALVNELLAQVWEETGTDASEIFYLQQIEMVLREASKIPSRLKLEQVNVIDSGDGKSLACLVNAYPEIFRQFLDRVDDTLGINVMGNPATRNGHKAKV